MVFLNLFSYDVICLGSRTVAGPRLTSIIYMISLLWDWTYTYHLMCSDQWGISDLIFGIYLPTQIAMSLTVYTELEQKWFNLLNPAGRPSDEVIVGRVAVEAHQTFVETNATLIAGIGLMGNSLAGIGQYFMRNFYIIMVLIGTGLFLFFLLGVAKFGEETFYYFGSLGFVYAAIACLAELCVVEPKPGTLLFTSAICGLLWKGSSWILRRKILAAMEYRRLDAGGMPY